MPSQFSMNKQNLLKHLHSVRKTETHLFDIKVRMKKVLCKEKHRLMKEKQLH